MIFRSVAFRLAPLSLGFVLCVSCAKDNDPIVRPATSGGSSSKTNVSAGAGSGATGGEGGASGTAVVTEYLIDDYEDGDSKSLSNGVWYCYDDRGTSGASKLEFPNAPDGIVAMTGEGYESTRSLWVRYTFDQGNGSTSPYVGFGVRLGFSYAPFDASPYGNIKYAYKGAAHSVRLEISTVSDYDYHQRVVPASDQWTTVTLPLTDLVQAGWGKYVDFDLAKVTNLSFEMYGTTGTTGDLQLDDLVLSGVPQPVVKVKDLQLLDAAPPTKTVLDSLVITNPLHQKAMMYLNHGTNLSNWLEQATFTGFGDYDDAYIAKLAAVGFRSLRLPLDLDRYADVNGDIKPELFTILDAYSAWTAKYGLSLTIDYHAYDNSLSLTNAESQDLAVSLWGQVAKHFAGNTREDLFFELLNEPELSMGVSAVPQATWTALAERMIGAIREVDQTHTILFGDVNWYGIDELVSRRPLSDTNVIYVFHDYEPFIFTSQGASWTGVGGLHDIPFPYDVSRWSEYSSDFGAGVSVEPWALQALQYYYKWGNQTALYNRAAMAKKWAVMNNVPVICNEFGAYATRSKLEDRVRYYEAIIAVFESLEIPWQHWYQIIDPKTGAVVPAEYQVPFGLTN